MNIHEYQAKQLLAQYGVTVPPGDVCATPEAARAVAEKVFAGGAKLIVVKSQIHAGGRGKGTFKSGFQGGVKLCKSADEVFEKAKAMLGQVLVTKQTGPDGRLVSKLLVAAAHDIKKELYLAVLLDRATSRPLIMASTEGGVDIEEVAEKHPEKIVKEWIDPAVGIMPYQARKIASALGLKGDAFNSGVKLLLGVYKTWWECDAAMVEINPLCIVTGADGKDELCAVDAQDRSRRQRALSPQEHPGDARSGRGSAAGNRSEQVQPELHQARRQHRLPRQRRGSGDGDDGHHPAFRRRVRRTSSTWAAARARSRSRRRSRSSCKTRT